VKYLAWLVAALLLAVGAAAIVSPESVVRLRSLAATQAGLLVIASVRIAIGVILIMSAPASRTPKLLQALGAVALLAGLATPFFGVERTKAVLDWEAAQGPMLMRVLGVFVAALGGLLGFVLSPARRT